MEIPNFFEWSCSICTYVNSSSATICEMCGGINEGLSTPPSSKSSEPTRKQKLSNEEDWICEMCTYANPSSATLCRMCSMDRPFDSNKRLKKESETVACPHRNCGVVLSPEQFDEHLALHQYQEDIAPKHSNGSEEEEWHRLRRRYGFEHKPDDAHSYTEQYEKSLEREWAENKISSAELQKRKAEVVENLRGPEKYQGRDLIPLIKATLSKSKGVHSFYVCGPLNHYCSDRGDRGWGCGYRNIQMLSSHLFNFANFRKALFKGCNYIPNVPSLQEWIQLAWQQGFDVDGASQLGYDIFNTKRMIGATECATLFRSFGVRAKVFDFYSRKNPNYDSSQAMVVLAQQDWPRDRKVKKKKGPSPWLPNKQLVAFAWNYFQERKDSSFVPPLYLQHEGHSRTIVGAEKRNSDISLLIFDPSHFSPVLRQDLEHGNLKKLRKSEASFTHEKYQIIMVESEELITPDQMRHWKHLTSTKVT